MRHNRIFSVVFFSVVLVLTVFFFSSCENEPKDCGMRHDWGAWSVSVEASCEEDGEEERFCSVCRERDTREIPATGHSYSTPEFIWTFDDEEYDFTACEAVFTCTKDETHILRKSCEIDKVVDYDRDLICLFETASVTIDGRTFKDRYVLPLYEYKVISLNLSNYKDYLNVGSSHSHNKTVSAFLSKKYDDPSIKYSYVSVTMSVSSTGRWSDGVGYNSWGSLSGTIFVSEFGISQYTLNSSSSQSGYLYKSDTFNYSVTSVTGVVEGYFEITDVGWLHDPQT